MNPSREYSDKLWQEAMQPLSWRCEFARALFRGVGGTRPFFTQRAKGARYCHSRDAADANDGTSRCYVVLVGADDDLGARASEGGAGRAGKLLARDGTSFGTRQSRCGCRHAQFGVWCVSASIQKVRFVNSGTEADHVRYSPGARSLPKRDKILKFEGLLSTRARGCAPE